MKREMGVDQEEVTGERKGSDDLITIVNLNTINIYFKLFGKNI